MSSELYKIYEGEFLSTLQEIDEILLNFPANPQKCTDNPFYSYENKFSNR